MELYSQAQGPGSSIRSCVLVELAEEAQFSLGEAVGLHSVVVECSPSGTVAVGSVGGARVLGKVRKWCPPHT